ncbi:MAG: helix-turn-helix domain-containing protein, partial [Haliea sp.]|nr:helix-turn-helix domain-containing protein [Haliea sp.]
MLDKKATAGRAGSTGHRQPDEHHQRTLRRHLQQEDTTYQALLDTVRRERASYYLHQTALSLQEISSRLGYQHLTAFNAAYKRWTGRTPARS